MKQLSFLPKVSLEHGGHRSRGKRKITRPFDPKKPLHLSLTASRARGEWSMLHRRHKGQIHFLVSETAEKYRVKLYRFANVGNHMHLLVQARKRQDFQGFLRELTGRIATLITGAIKGAPEKFWDHLAYSKVISFGREFEHVQAYLIKNLLEGMGAIDRYGVDRNLKIALVTTGRAPPGRQR